MVGRGEVLERMTTVPSPSGPLEALWQAGGVGVEHRMPILVCPPHPRLGGSMDSAILAEIVWQLARRHHPTLRFNHAGVSASAGTLALPWLPTTDVVDLTPLVDDAKAALAQLLASTGAREIGVVGVSVGALVAARLLLEHDAVMAGALVAPPLMGVVGPGLAIDIEALRTLQAGGCPMVIVVGEADTLVNADDIDAAINPPPTGVANASRGSQPRLRVERISGADHSFQRGMSACARAVVDTFGGPDDDDDDDDDSR